MIAFPRLPRVAWGFVACFFVSTIGAATPQSPGERMLEPGPEAQQLARQVGTWDVVMTMRPTPAATPIVVKDLVAERTMVGLYMTYDAVQARWEYVSMDTRAPIGIMSAKTYGVDQGPDITLYFDNFANPGLGAFGGSARARHVDKRESDDRHLKQQYWTVPGEPEWLAVQYEYRRRH